MHAESYQELALEQLYWQHENEKEGMYASRVMEVGHATFTPSVFTTNGDMAKECSRYHAKLAEL